MKSKHLTLFAYLLVVAMAAGCVDHYVLVDKISPAANLDSPTELFPRLNFAYVKQNDDGSRMYSYKDRTIALLSLKYTSRHYDYFLNETGRIVRAELTEYSWQPRLLPRFRLSDSFKEFR